MSIVATEEPEFTTLTLQEPKSYFKKIRIGTEWRITPTNKNVDTETDLSQSMYSLSQSDFGGSSKFDLDLDL